MYMYIHYNYYIHMSSILVPACSVSIMYSPKGPGPALLMAITCTVYAVKGIRFSMVAMVTLIPPIVGIDVTPSLSNTVTVYSVMGRREKGESHCMVLERGPVTSWVINGAPGGPVGVVMGVVTHKTNGTMFYL